MIYNCLYNIWSGKQLFTFIIECLILKFDSILCSNKLTEKCGEAELEGKLNIKVAYVDNKRVPVRRWHRILVKIIGDKLQISLVNDTEPPEVSQSYKICMQSSINKSFNARYSQV